MFEKVNNYAKEHSTAIILIIIVLLGSLLRIKGLTYQSYWLDELYSVDFSSPTHNLGTMLSLTLNDLHPPLYQTLLWVLYHLFGYSELVGKMFSAIMGILSVIAIYFLGKELFNKQIGLYASFFAATNYFLIYYSQETRSYSLLLLFSIISYTYLIKVFNETTRKNILLYWLCTIVLLYTHYFGFFLVFTQVFFFLWLIISLPKKRIDLIKLAIYTAIIFSLSLLPIIKYIIINSGIDAWWIGKPSPVFFVSYIYAYFHSATLTIIFGVSSFISLWYLTKQATNSREKTALILLLIWITIGFLLPYLMSVLSAPLLTTRNTIIILPTILILASYGIWRIGGWKKIILLVLIAFLSLYTLRTYYNLPIKGQYREVIKTIKKYQAIPVYNAIPYGTRMGTNHYQTYADLLHLDLTVKTRKMLEEDKQNIKLPNCFWVVDAQGDHINDLNLEENSLYQQLYEINLYGANAVLFSSQSDTKLCEKIMGMNLQ